MLLVFPRYLLGLHALLDPVAEWLVWYSGMPIVLGLGLALIDLLVFLDPQEARRAGPLRSGRAGEK